MQQPLCTSVDCTSVVLRPPVRPIPVHWFNIYWFRYGFFGSSVSYSKPLKVLKSEGRYQEAKNVWSKFHGDAVVKIGTAACLQFLWETQMCGKSVFLF